METINVAPSVEGLLRYFREVYGTDRTRAINLVIAAWPMSIDDAEAVLGGSKEVLTVVVERRNLARGKFMTITDAHRVMWQKAAEVAEAEQDADAHRNLSQAAAMYTRGSLMPSSSFDALMKEFRRLVIR